MDDWKKLRLTGLAGIFAALMGFAADMLLYGGFYSGSASGPSHPCPFRRYCFGRFGQPVFFVVFLFVRFPHVAQGWNGLKNMFFNS